MKEIEESAAYMAGYGIKLVPVIQNIGQVEELYDKNWETFLGNAGAIIAWGLNDHRSEKYISERLGNVLRWEISKSAGSSTKAGDFFAASTSENLSTALHERPVRRPNEVHTDGARDEYRAFIVPASSEPFMVRRVEYFRQWQNDQIYDDPTFIDTWEAEYGTYS
jgi:type IV secretion system protein VirD4